MARLECFAAAVAGSGSPVPCRRTFAPAIVASAHSEPPALRHPWLRLPSTPAPRARATPP